MNIDIASLRQNPVKFDADKFDIKKEALVNHYSNRFIARGYDNTNKHLFENLTNFCAYYYAGVNRKGLFLCARDGDINTGTGKTFGMNIIGEIFNIRVVLSSFLTKAYVDNQAKYQELLLDRNYYGSSKITDLIVDEVGAETIACSYGKKEEVFVDVVESRYLEFIKNKSFVHFTSNLSKIQQESRYGHRIWSRLNEMCTIIEIGGVDRRLQ